MAIGTGIAMLGASLIGGAASVYGAGKAADSQERLAQQGYQNQLALYRESRRDLKPYLEVGKGATTTLAKLYGIPTPDNPNAEAFGKEATDAFKRSPDYQFAFDEGRRALEFSNAAKGQLLSGNNMRDITEFGQGVASQNFGNYANRLMQLSQLGQNTAVSGSGQALQFGGQQANQLGNIGQAQASGIIGQTNAFNQALGQGTNNLLLYNQLQNQGGSAYDFSGYQPNWNTQVNYG